MFYLVIIYKSFITPQIWSFLKIFSFFNNIYIFFIYF